MKKFHFGLDTVLRYKTQTLDNLQEEHGVILAQVMAQEEVLTEAYDCYRRYNDEFCEKKNEGITCTDAQMFQMGLRAQELVIQVESERLEGLKKLAEAKRQEVVAAKQETTSIEKLRSKQVDAYNKAVQKSEEQKIDEYVSAARHAAAQA